MIKAVADEADCARGMLVETRDLRATGGGARRPEATQRWADAEVWRCPPGVLSRKTAEVPRVGYGVRTDGGEPADRFGARRVGPTRLYFSLVALEDTGRKWRGGRPFQAFFFAKWHPGPAAGCGGRRLPPGTDWFRHRLATGRHRA